MDVSGGCRVETRRSSSSFRRFTSFLFFVSLFVCFPFFCSTRSFFLVSFLVRSLGSFTLVYDSCQNELFPFIYFSPSRPSSIASESSLLAILATNAAVFSTNTARCIDLER